MYMNGGTVGTILIADRASAIPGRNRAAVLTRLCARLRTSMGTESSASLSKTVSLGISQQSLKGEDFATSLISHEKERAIFGIFDSHGGKEAGAMCSEQMPQPLLSLTDDAVAGHQAFPDSCIIDEFWKMDHQLGSANIFSGTTACVLLVATAVDSLCCTLAWVGDSTAICVSMLPCKESILHATSNHTPSNKEESNRCALEWEVRRKITVLKQEAALGTAADESDEDDENNALEKGDSFKVLNRRGVSFYAKRKAPTQADVESAVAASGLEIDALSLDLLVRALGREKRIEAPERHLKFLHGRDSGRQDTSVITRAMNATGPQVHSDC